MTVLVLTCPILPGKVEAWRRFCQELSGTRRRQYIESRRRLGITAEQVGLLRTAQAAIAVIHIKAARPEQLLRKFIASEQPFDRWFKRRIFELHGVDVSHSLPVLSNEVVFEWPDECRRLATKEEQ